ncbi:aspartate-semialdehyde dehydrogenase [Acidaminobacter sp. JC074]|uniref:aspartate-semialdehyde dehydrogenase n=1 Tax=Acidaminobacter sp. JC074 TaxID=2530199 RepID=UPI001F0EFBA8|nr:aspartate-semialdehyde dehydrogenase [Acidaminobacter sp. JC074]MCH4891271.1 aspartate-semialdehyde dehydrogenase [Acidaminobacter sp. JC074]
MKKVNIAVVGATGMVGRTFLKVLEERDFPYNKIYCFASKRSAGTKVKCKGEDIIVEELTETSFDRDIDIALFSAGGTTSEKFAPIAASKGVIVVDNSSHFRMDKDVPLVVPEVNPHAIFEHKNIIANPNCSTIQAMVALKPLQEKYGIKRVVFSTYQAVSGSGVKGVTDLENGLKGSLETNCYPHPIANNCLPHIDVFMDNGYTKEEMKMINETKKILGDDSLKITATAVRVPLYDCHSESINVELDGSFDIENVFELYRDYKGIILQDDVANNVYPLATTAKGTDDVYIGRIRRDFSLDNGLNIWVVADNIRKGAATNAVQIAEVLITR